MIYSNKLHDIFISHATLDKDAIAIPLTNALNEKGLVVFRDDISIPTGQSISMHIKKAAAHAKVGVIILSTNYFGVDKYYTLWELGLLDHCELVYIFYNTTPEEVSKKMTYLGDLKGFPIRDVKNLRPIVDDVCEKFKIADNKRIKERSNKLKKIVTISSSLFLLLLITFLYILSNDRSTNNNNSITKSFSSIDSIKIKKSYPTSSHIIKPIPKSELNNEEQTNIRNSQTLLEGKNDYSIHVNSSLVNSIDNIDVSVTIVDNETNTIDHTLSSDIANIYTKAGNKGNTGLLRSTFFKKPQFQEVFEGNSDILEKLKLNTHTDYLALGKIVYSIHPGSLVNGTFICDISLTMSILPVSSKSLSQSSFISFNVNGIGNDVSESRAKDKAIQNLIYNYGQEHSSL